MSGQVDYDRESGKCAYDAYRHALQNQSASHERLPDWDDLLNRVQETWMAVASAVRQHDRERASQF